MALTGQMTLQRWFVKTDGKIRGPFPESVLASMVSRGRIRRDTEVSVDRHEWIPAAQLTSLFPTVDSDADQSRQPNDRSMIPAAMPSLPTSSALSQQKCFYSVDGIVHGPLSLHELQSRVRAGQVSQTDFVWIEGNSDWLPANEIRELSFPMATLAFKSWASMRLPHIVGGVCVSIVLLGVPTWYVLSHARYEERKLHQKQVTLQQQREREEQLRKEKQARKDQADKDDREQIRWLVAQRNQLQLQRDSVNQTYTALRLAQQRHDEQIQRLAELDQEIKEMDTEIKSRMDAYDAGQRRLQDELTQQSEERWRQGDEMRRSNLELENTARNVEREEKRHNRKEEEHDRKVENLLRN